MRSHPVHLHVERTRQPRRIHVVLRLVLLVAIGTVGVGALYWMLYLALPALVALAILHRGEGRYLAEDAPRVARILRWVAGAYAYLWLLTDVPPTAEPGPVELHVEPGGAPTPTSALLRLVYSLPALVLVAVLSIVGSLGWAVGAVWILLFERLPGFIGDFLALTLRTELRLLAYHLSLVDAYPSLADDTVAHAAT
jgi:hypothetical protein